MNFKKITGTSFKYFADSFEFVMSSFLRRWFKVLSSKFFGDPDVLVVDNLRRRIDFI